MTAGGYGTARLDSTSRARRQAVLLGAGLPRRYCVLPNGRQGIVSRFGCVAIPWSRVLGIVSPDGAPHLCEAPLTTVFVPYCVVLGANS